MLAGLLLGRGEGLLVGALDRGLHGGAKHPDLHLWFHVEHVCLEARSDFEGLGLQLRSGRTTVRI